GALWSFEAAAKRLPRPGDLSVVTAWDGTPLCVIRSTQVQVMPFDTVPEDFAAAEGEGDGSLEYWRRAHTAYFGRECARLGRSFSPDMPVCCEHFDMVYAPPGA
ncbi:MAG TPA: ASCH domain-containing protein, partial [Rubrivivax sp.]|nr:ASCH domain-containing protein [Rubrivivax sp.]